MANTGMAEYWNGRPADVWVTEAERFDSMLAPFGRPLLTAAAPEPGERVLDVGCGNGAISLQAARAAGPRGQVTGMDLSAAMLGSPGGGPRNKGSTPTSSSVTLRPLLSTSPSTLS